MFLELEELPDGWIRTDIGHLTQPSKAKVEPNSLARTTYIGLEHIESQTGRLVGRGVSSDVRSTKAVFNKGDLLYGKLRPYLNKVYLSETEGICSTDILVFPESEHLSNSYLAYRFLSDEFVRYANAHSTGVQHPRVKFEALSEFPLPLPPLNEQRRIVAKIEELTARSRRAREALDDVPTLINQFRQSVLAAAFRGDLTADWREKNPEFRNTLKDEKDSKIYHSKLNPDIFQLAAIHKIPDSWSWVPLDSLGRWIGGGTPSKRNSDYWDGPIPG